MHIFGFKNIVLNLLCVFAVLTGAGCSSNKEEATPEENPTSLVISLDKQSGFYDESFMVHLSANTKAEIFYTFDGSEPTRDSFRYTNGIEIINASNKPNIISNVRNISSLSDVYFPDFNVDKCTILKIKGFGNNGLVSDTITKFYFVGLDQQYYSKLPIINLSTEFNNLFDYDEGIYVTGRAYDEGENTHYPEEHPANYMNKGKEWEKVSEISFFDENHNFIEQQSCGIRIHGGWTRAQNQKSFNIYARKELDGNKKMNINLFDNISPKSFMLRTGGYRDSSVTKIRDSMIQTLCAGLGFETQQAYPCILFLNGEYWGIYDIQERFSDSFIEEHYGIDKDNVIIFETDELDEGKDSDIEFYNSMISFFQNCNLANGEEYNQASKIIDIDGFANYMCAELMVGNADWPNNNFRMWRSREPGENQNEDCKWRFMMYDTDDSCGMIDRCSTDSNPFLDSSHWSKGPLNSDCTIGLIFNALLSNKDFKDKFLDRVSNMVNKVLNVDKVDNYLNEQKQILMIPIVKHYQRFVSNDTNIYNKDYFLNEIEKIHSFFKNRPNYFLNYVSNLFI